MAAEKVSVLEIVQLLDLAISFAMRAGVSMAQFHAMREASGGNLTREQIESLAASARAKVDAL